VAAALRKDRSLTVDVAPGHYGEFAVLVEGQEILSAGALAVLGIVPSVRVVQEAIERARQLKHSP